ncbi:hypothetical protein [Sutcliffiella sp. NC1]|uniref:hypothetical protein n=1 Tax=Sutcliffiella sp. NC1 TaxID=3004096 RepID=UPI0022DE7739|nr:hypothetical protein [Sutcliffiella sp. NC1]WBL15113.1 hypothetical protein O1A01_25180 [Sutcliffiella sp. NC1]
MALIEAKVGFRGIKPLLYHCFSIDALAIGRKERVGTAGNNPEEWKSTVKTTENGQFYLPFSYAFSCALNGAKMLRKGKGTYLKDVASTLDILDEKILLNRFMPNNILERTENDDVFIDVRGVNNTNNRGSKNIRYRVCLNPGWEGEFAIKFENTIVGIDLMEQILIDGGRFSGFGDGRNIGFGKFIITKFEVGAKNAEEKIG